ncbi:MAG: ImmA/IrrE family metallo-endopeptidase, partial [Frankiaceae bacterium]|nr:ImmA/IrrE family metallo-endopeptidase [Frankiaceae bacterium]
MEEAIAELTVYPSMDEWIDNFVSDVVGSTPPLPIDIAEIAGALGCEVVLDPDLASSGSTQAPSLSGGSYRLFVKAAKLESARARFTVAHELAHAVLHRLSDGAFLEGPDVEAVCDSLAINMLAPTAILISYVNEHGLSLETIEELAEAFAVPLDVLLARVRQLVPATTTVEVVSGAPL